MTKKFNISIFAILIFAYLALAFVAYCAALSLDDGRPLPVQLQYIAYTFYLLRFPFWIMLLRSDFHSIILLAGLLLDCGIYAFLTERPVFIFRSITKKVCAKTAA